MTILLLREVILREIGRWAWFIISTMMSQALKIAEKLDHACARGTRVIVGHGQMRENELRTCDE